MGALEEELNEAACQVLSSSMAAWSKLWRTALAPRELEKSLAWESHLFRAYVGQAFSSDVAWLEGLPQRLPLNKGTGWTSCQDDSRTLENGIRGICCWGGTITQRNVNFLTEVVSVGPSQQSASHLLLFPGCPYFILNRICGRKEFTQCDGVSNISVLIWKNAVKSQAKGAMGKEQLLECIRYHKISIFVVENVPTVWKEWTLVQLKEF